MASAQWRATYSRCGLNVTAWEAGREAAREARGGALGEAAVDFAFVFLSAAHLGEAAAAAAAVREELAPRHLLGCVAEKHVMLGIIKFHDFAVRNLTAKLLSTRAHQRVAFLLPPCLCFGADACVRAIW